MSSTSPIAAAASATFEPAVFPDTDPPLPAPSFETPLRAPTRGLSDPSAGPAEVPLRVSPAAVHGLSDMNLELRAMKARVLHHLKSMAPLTVMLRDDLVILVHEFSYCYSARLEAGVEVLIPRFRAYRRHNGRTWSVSLKVKTSIGRLVGSYDYVRWCTKPALRASIPGLDVDMPLSPVATTDAFLAPGAELLVASWMAKCHLGPAALAVNRAAFDNPPIPVPLQRLDLVRPNKPMQPVPAPLRLLPRFDLVQASKPVATTRDTRLPSLAVSLCSEVIAHLEPMLPLVLRTRDGSLLYVHQFRYYLLAKGGYFLVPILIEGYVAETGRVGKHNFSYMVGTRSNYVTWGVSEDLGLRVEGLDADLPFASVYCETALLVSTGESTARKRLDHWKATFSIAPERLQQARDDYEHTVAPFKPTILRRKRAAPEAPGRRLRPRVVEECPLSGTSIEDSKEPVPLSPSAPLPSASIVVQPSVVVPSKEPALPSAPSPPPSTPIVVQPSAVAPVVPPQSATRLGAAIDHILADADRLKDRLEKYVADASLVNGLVSATVSEALASVATQIKRA